MSQAGPWTNEDFEHLSWHDVNVHGWRLDTFDSDEGCADLVLDIDFILHWEKSGSAFLFTVCRADLCFHQVLGLRLALDYATPTAGMCPFSIDGIVRELLVAPNGHRSYRWRLPVNWPRGLLEFEAPAFTQTLTGTPRVQAAQWLAGEHRDDAN